MCRRTTCSNTTSTPTRPPLVCSNTRSTQAEACRRDLGIPEEKLNIEGGAIALGHPLGATGGRLVGKASQLLKREKAKYALATQCIGGGMGIAMVLEAV